MLYIIYQAGDHSSSLGLISENGHLFLHLLDIKALLKDFLELSKYVWSRLVRFCFALSLCSATL